MIFFILIFTTLSQDLNLISPVFRNSLSTSTCKSNEAEQSHLLTSLGNLEPLIFDVIEPEHSSNCSLKLFPKSDSSKYIDVLNIMALQKWPCARSKGIERNSFKIPQKFICSDCTIQLSVESLKGAKYACADALVSTGKSECSCKNKGVCIDGLCSCVKGYTGNQCEIGNTENQTFHYVWQFLFVCLVVVVLCSTVYYYMHPELLPKNIVEFLDKNARWMLRNPSNN